MNPFENEVKVPPYLIERAERRRALLSEATANEEQDPKNTLHATLALSREMATNGVCSMLTLEAINDVHQNATGKTEKLAVTTLDTGVSEIVNAQAFEPTARIKDGWVEGVLVANHIDEATSQLFFKFDYGSKAILLWQLTENDPKTGRCSESWFLPASQSHEIDYSLVMTPMDEARPASAEELVSEKPMTNAVVLKQLIECLNGRNNNLGELIKLKELLGETKNIIQPELHTYSEVDDPLVRHLGKISGLAALAETAVTKSHKFNDETSISLEFSPEGRVDVSATHHDLGKNGLSTSMGSIVLRGQQLLGEYGGVEAPEPIELARAALEIPEIIVDEQLQQLIQEEIRDGEELEIVDFNIIKHIREYRRRLNGWTMQDSTNSAEYNEAGAYRPGDPIIDIGSVDFRSLRYGGREEVFQNAMGLKAEVYLGRYNQVFTGASYLYECTVIGGAEAFYNSRYILRSCHKPSQASLFSGSFQSANYISECIVDGATSAFNNAKQVVDSLAVDCSSAFSEASTTRCVAIGCRNSFYEANVDECTVYDPRLIGTNFMTHLWSDTGIPSLGRGRLIKNRLTGTYNNYRRKKQAANSRQ